MGKVHTIGLFTDCSELDLLTVVSSEICLCDILLCLYLVASIWWLASGGSRLALDSGISAAGDFNDSGREIRQFLLFIYYTWLTCHQFIHYAFPCCRRVVL